MRIYIETTIPSYLTARPSRDLLQAARQEITREWWESERGQIELYISEYVIAEAGFGSADAAGKRLELLEGLPSLDVTDAVEDLAKEILAAELIPYDAAPDAFHIAIAAVHEMDVLLTWNCRHIANPMILGRINCLMRSLGYEPPLVCTPEEMLGE